MQIIDMVIIELCELNSMFQVQVNEINQIVWVIENFKGVYVIVVGFDVLIEVMVKGLIGYYCVGMNKQVIVYVIGLVGLGVVENMMLGIVIIDGDVS